MVDVPIKIILADDNVFFLEALEDSLKKLDSLEIINSFSSIQSLIEYTNTKATFDILILDVNFNGINSLDYITHIHPKTSNFKIIVLTTLDEDYTKAYAKECGVDAFVSKNGVFSDFEEIIKECFYGDLSTTEKGENNNVKSYIIGGEKFTNTKIKVLKALYEYPNCTENEIALILNISTSALKTHKQNLFEMTNSKKISGLIKFGLKHGILLS